MKNSRIIVVSNRLPVAIKKTDNQIAIEHASGGLVSALEPVMKRTGGCWVGWAGTDLDAEIYHALSNQQELPFRLEPVGLTDQEVSEYYDGFSNGLLWPLFHGLQNSCRYDSDLWETYLNVNEKFADVVEATASPNDFIWVHDYHLMMVASAIRSRHGRLKLGYFHHVPFPEPEVFGRIPWRLEILRALLQFNIIGFQTTQDKRNFIASIKRWAPSPVCLRKISDAHLISALGRQSVVGAFPISIDFKKFDCPVAETTAIGQSVSEKLLFGLDRLDCTKGVLERLAAFELLLTRHPDLVEKVRFLQVVVPSREHSPAYLELRHEIERTVSDINGRYGSVGWTPITYLYRSLTQQELIDLYQRADVAVVTPLRDGMNLVAKEFCASRSDCLGVLVLSEFAGAAEELRRGALIVNPNNLSQVADAMRQALAMPANEMKRRMNMLREQIKSHDVWRWFSAFLSKRIAPVRYVPELDALQYPLGSLSTNEVTMAVEAN